MMNNDYKNIIWGRHVWLTFTAPGTCCCNKEKTVFVTPPAPCLFFTDYPQYSAVIIGNHMIFFRAIWDKSALVNFSKTQPNCTSPGTGNVMGQSLDNFNATPRLDKKKQFQLKVSFGSGLVSSPPPPTPPLTKPRWMRPCFGFPFSLITNMFKFQFDVEGVSN